MTILDSVLTKRQKDAGFYFLTGESYRIYLMRDNRVINHYPFEKVTIDQIRHDADQELNWTSSGITFERKV